MDTINSSSEIILLVAIIQFQDVNEATSVLEQSSIAVTQLPSVGVFLGQKNVTMLIPIRSSQMDEVVHLLEKTCKQRIEYMAVSMEYTSSQMSSPIAVSVGGATIFSLDLDQYEEI